MPTLIAMPKFLSVIFEYLWNIDGNQVHDIDKYKKQVVDEIILVLKENLTFLNSIDNDGNTPIMLATLYDQPELIAALAKIGSNVNQTDQNGRTPLMRATTRNQAECVTVLLRHDADVNVINNTPYLGIKHRETAMMNAAYSADGKIARKLLRAGALKTLFEEDEHGFNAFEIAIANQNREVIDVFKKIFPLLKFHDQQDTLRTEQTEKQTATASRLTLKDENQTSTTLNANSLFSTHKQESPPTTSKPHTKNSRKTP